MEVTVFSSEFIKPSSKTPNHLKYYQLSFLDQMALSVYMPIILYYQIESSSSIFVEESLRNLKKSISQTLTVFYPLAGRVKANDSVLCNDEGALFVVANANSSLSNFLQDPNQIEINKLIPLKSDAVNDLPAAFQITLFNGGGVSIAFCISHKVGDAYSMYLFYNYWASISRGEKNVATPLFNSAELFPPKYSEDVPRYQISKENLVIKPFKFEGSSILAIQDEYANNGNGKAVSAYQALSAFILKRYIEAVEADKSELDKVYILAHAMNLRPVMKSSDAMRLFGNIVEGAVGVAKMGSTNDDCGILNSMRDAMRNVNAESVRKLKTHDLDFDLDNFIRHNKAEIHVFAFSGLKKLSFYEANFGWGKPIWVSLSQLAVKNQAIFFDAEDGNGIEAWVSLKEEDMSKFQINKKLLTYAYPLRNINSGFTPISVSRL